jgi:hypothetical protein
MKSINDRRNKREQTSDSGRSDFARLNALYVSLKHIQKRVRIKSVFIAYIVREAFIAFPPSLLLPSTLTGRRDFCI